MSKVVPSNNRMLVGGVLAFTYARMAEKKVSFSKVFVVGNAIN